MKNILKTGLVSAVAAIVSFSSVAFADHYSIELNRSDNNYNNVLTQYSSDAGKVQDFDLEYNLHDNTLSFYTRITEHNYGDTSGFWMVLNGGGFPHQSSDKLAILYGDLINDKLTAYVYEGSDSWDGGQYLGTYDLDGYYNDAPGDTGVYTAAFDISLDDLNDPTGKPGPWKGAQFGNTVGIWFQNFDGDFSYNSHTGRITHLSWHKDGWVDTPGVHTEFTPWVTTSEPAPLGLFLLAGVAAFLLRRRGTQSKVAFA